MSCINDSFMTVFRQLIERLAVFFYAKIEAEREGKTMAYTPQIYYPGSAFNPYQQNYQPIQQTIPQQIQQPQPQMQMTQNNQGLIWVSGEIGAKSYLMAPNSTVMLMDSERSVFYIKSTDGAGMPTLRTYEYKEFTQDLPQPQQGQQTEQMKMETQYVTREEYNALIKRCEDLEKELKTSAQQPLQRSKKKVEAEDE